ncbi:MAG: dUTP diphosphatase [Patescibacteria group bacterium]
MLKVKIKRFDKSLPLPEYKTKGAAAVDLCARETVVIAPRTVGYVPLNIGLELPTDHWALVTARSSLHKKGLMMANGVGVGDSDYCGDGDEYRAALLNFTDKEAVVERGERIVQLIIMARQKVELVELERFTNADRGGFGSTGK